MIDDATEPAMLDGDDYKMHLQQAHMLCWMASQIPLTAMINMASRAEAVGMMVDPTLYRAKAQALSEDIEILRALARLPKHRGAGLR